MGTYYKPQSPIQSGEDFIYPLTTADQVIVDENTRLNAVLSDFQTKTRINYLRPTLQTQTINGITLTNDNGKIALNGTQTASFTIVVGMVLLKSNKTYKMIGCKNGGWGTYSLRLFSSSDDLIIGDIGEGNVYTPNNDEVCTVKIHITSASATFDNVVFKPMITDDLSATYDDFVSYNDSLVKGRDIIDQSSIGDAWTASKTYAVGDYCIYGNQLYKCKIAHTAGSAFSPDYWDDVSVSGEILSLKTTYIPCYNIGQSTISQLETAFQSCGTQGGVSGYTNSGSEGYYIISKDSGGGFCGGMIFNKGMAYLLKRDSETAWYMRPVLPN